MMDKSGEDFVGYQDENALARCFQCVAAHPDEGWDEGERCGLCGVVLQTVMGRR